jgi:hypothetical protein
VLHPSLSIVCLPKDTSTAQMAEAADAALTRRPGVDLRLAWHFLTRGRRQRRRVLHPWRNIAAGGPVKLLDLDAMRAATERLYGHRWWVWNQVIAGTRPAQPYWVFLDRAHHDPAKYPLGRAQRDYLAQPRIASMRTYNALPHRVADLPTAHLEAFQTGANAYAGYGWLTAVPGDALVCPGGALLTAGTGDHATRLSYLHTANAQVAALDGDDILVAIRTQ